MDDAIVIDLSKFKNCSVDSSARTVTVEGGVKVRLDEERRTEGRLERSDSKCNMKARVKRRQEQCTASLQEKNLLLVASLLTLYRPPL